MNNLASIDNILNMEYKREQNMAGHAVAVESQFTQLASVKTEFDYFTRRVIVNSTLKERNGFKALIEPVSWMKEENLSWSVISLFHIEQSKQLDDNLGYKAYENRSQACHSAQMWRRFQPKKSMPHSGDVICSDRNKKGHMMRDCHTLKAKEASRSSCPCEQTWRFSMDRVRNLDSQEF